MKKMNSFNLKKHVPTKQNSFVYLNALFLLYLLIIGKVDPLTIVTAYFLETAIVGVVYVFKMYTIISFGNKKEKNPSYSNYSLILFFIVHFSFFIAIQLIFVFAFLTITDNNIKEAFNILENIKYVLTYKGITFVLISITAYNFADYVFNFIIPKKYETSSLNKIFTEPYIRIFVQQFTVIVSGFFIVFSSGITVVAIILIIFRTLIEIYFIANPTNNILDGNEKPII
ncbi:DUF6498-containing protein [Lutibacter sp.]|uniref:DUF6498-containing protein n=1 Tax=Lutibacter sp. TaxID=1925666 RepID=UPI001A32E546|nr:DUF6498-containing protein [Lutibacter sp.]MBI9040389.1 hypothetical protein [Lutibacter sp.]